MKIVDYNDKFGNAFERLNREWLEKYFRVEEIDREMLSDPQTNIIDPGGAILYALSGADVMGTVALKRQGDGIYELTKMAVTQSAQGKGAGRLLLHAALARFRALHGKTLYLESHSSLRAALTLYESAGFVREPSPAPSEYERADVYMVYRPD